MWETPQWNKVKLSQEEVLKYIDSQKWRTSYYITDLLNIQRSAAEESLIEEQSLELLKILLKLDKAGAVQKKMVGELDEYARIVMTDDMHISDDEVRAQTLEKRGDRDYPAYRKIKMEKKSAFSFLRDRLPQPKTA